MKLVVATRPPLKASDGDAPVVQPPSTLTVIHDPKVWLWTADGKPMIRVAGF